MTSEVVPTLKRVLLDSSPQDSLKKGRKSYQPKIEYFFKQSPPTKMNFYDSSDDSDEFTRMEEENFTMEVLRRAKLRAEEEMKIFKVQDEIILPIKPPETPQRMVFHNTKKILSKTPKSVSKPDVEQPINMTEQLEKLISILSYSLLLKNCQTIGHKSNRMPCPYAISTFHWNEEKTIDQCYKMLFEDKLKDGEFKLSLKRAWTMVNPLQEFEDFKCWFPYSHYSNKMSRLLTMVGYNLAKENELTFQANFKCLPQEVLARTTNLLQKVKSQNQDNYFKLTNKCPECPFRSESKMVMDDHRAKPHLAWKVYSDEKDVLDYYYRCSHCASSQMKCFPSFQYHMQQIHKVPIAHIPFFERVPAKYVCSRCAYEVNTKRYYEKHFEKCVATTTAEDDHFGVLSVQRNYQFYNPCKFESENKRRPDLAKFYANIQLDEERRSSANSSMNFPLEPYDRASALNSLSEEVAAKVMELSSSKTTTGLDEVKVCDGQDSKEIVYEFAHLKEILAAKVMELPPSKNTTGLDEVKDCDGQEDVKEIVYEFAHLREIQNIGTNSSLATKDSAKVSAILMDTSNKFQKLAKKAKPQQFMQ